MIGATRGSWEAVFRRLSLKCRFLPFLELDRRNVTQRRVPTLRVVEALDELEHDRDSLRLRVKLVLRQQLALERGEERLAHRVVEAVADRAHRWPHTRHATARAKL